MHFSIPLFPYDRWGGVEPIVKAAQQAEAMGFFGVTFPEHIIMPVRPDVPPVSVVWYDNFVLAAHIATLTRRLRLIFNVMVVPYRPPVQTAKMVSTLDAVSNGRLIVGVGAGWLRGEFRTLGVPHAERGTITDEYLRAMKALWTQEKPAFAGKYVSFANIAFLPKCVQQPHVPLWIGGSGPRPLARVVELGDGWAPMVGELPALQRDIATIKDKVRAAGRDPTRLEFSFSIAFGERDESSERARTHASRGAAEQRPLARAPGEVVDLVGQHREAGFTHLGLSFNWETPADYLKQLEWFAAKVMPAFKT